MMQKFSSDQLRTLKKLSGDNFNDAVGAVKIVLASSDDAFIGEAIRKININHGDCVRTLYALAPNKFIPAIFASILNGDSLKNYLLLMLIARPADDLTKFQFEEVLENLDIEALNKYGYLFDDIPYTEKYKPEYINFLIENDYRGWINSYTFNTSMSRLMLNQLDEKVRSDVNTARSKLKFGVFSFINKKSGVGQKREQNFYEDFVYFLAAAQKFEFGTEFLEKFDTSLLGKIK